MILVQTLLNARLGRVAREALDQALPHSDPMSVMFRRRAVDRETFVSLAREGGLCKERLRKDVLQFRETKKEELASLREFLAA